MAKATDLRVIRSQDQRPSPILQCQMVCLPGVAEPVGVIRRTWQFRNRLRRILKRRWKFLKKILQKRGATVSELSSGNTFGVSISSRLRPGDVVRVRSREEIEHTLNNWNQLRGCTFMEEMRPYCDTQQRVFKRMEQFLDERDYVVKRSKGLVILDGVICQGTKDFGRCDRSCYFFWREEWLEKMSNS